MGSFKKINNVENGKLKMQVRPIKTDIRELPNEHWRQIIEIKTQHDKFTLSTGEVKELINYLIRML